MAVSSIEERVRALEIRQEANREDIREIKKTVNRIFWIVLGGGAGIGIDVISGFLVQ